MIWYKFIFGIRVGLCRGGNYGPEDTYFFIEYKKRSISIGWTLCKLSSLIQTSIVLPVS